ncbi:DUF58 domain-containing protein [Natrialba sp. SSL1]|uniref:DUF58 domain-containing protein n=1 Tax=Natrialba sp. SSL1 TaxID=1869245 RepID=UPI0008F92874|nr:DUF58 domain-containing protein [Natrialba sp. SSL1]OIB59281.1 hypothetical protein BBD46_00950 [Natrialba sp. SSL1]
MNRRRTVLLLGLLALAVGIAVSVGVLEFSLTETAIMGVGLLAVLIGLRALGLRRGLERSPGSARAEPERRAAVLAPGESFSQSLAAFQRVTDGYAVQGRRTVDGLRAAVVAVCTRFRGDSVAEATDRIERGNWTDDRIAAAFLSDSVEVPSRSILDRVRTAVDREPSFQRSVRHTVAAIAAVGYDGTSAAASASAESGRGDEGDAERTRGADSSSDSSANTAANTDGNTPERSLPAYVYQPRSATSTDSDGPPRRTTDNTIDGISTLRTRQTGYWTGIGAVALLAVGIGTLAEAPGVILAGVVGIGYAGFARAFEPPEPDLAIERTLSNEEPDPGDEVEVRVTITNTSSRFVPDLRFVDGVPPGLAVTDGSSRLGTALRPGESVGLEYTVTVQRGKHEFDPALALVRDLSRSTEHEYVVGSETTVVCEPELRPVAAPVPLRTTAASFAGRLTTTEGGTGTTFHSVREYRPNDPLSRIDWNRRAKSGELATLSFHEERAARVVVLVDARERSFLAPEPDAAHAVDRSVAAAGRIAASLLAEGDTVGLAGIGPVGRDGTTSAASMSEPCWLAPASGRDHEIRFQELLATHPQFETMPPAAESRWLSQLRTIRRRLSAETQIVFLSPLCDSMAPTIARRLDARGHAVTVVSPDPTTDRTIGHQLAATARRVRRFDLQQAGIPVIDWQSTDSIDEVFARHAAGRGGRR